MGKDELTAARKLLEAQYAYNRARVAVSEGRATEREKDEVDEAVQRFAEAYRLLTQTRREG
jgi:flagellar biosynthesis/type III secretory pathway ATPase